MSCSNYTHDEVLEAEQTLINSITEHHLHKTHPCHETEEALSERTDATHIPSLTLAAPNKVTSVEQIRFTISDNSGSRVSPTNTAIINNNHWCYSNVNNTISNEMPCNDRPSQVPASTWSLYSFLSKLQELKLIKAIWIMFLVCLLMSGNIMQVIMLNFWLHQFPKDEVPGNYTTFAVSAFIFSVFFCLALCVYILLKRPSLKFTRHVRGWLWLLGIALMDTLNSALCMYAASHTSEVLQALFLALVPVYAAYLTKWMLKDPRNYCNKWIASSFMLIVGGVLLAASWEMFDRPSPPSALVYNDNVFAQAINKLLPSWLSEGWCESTPLGLNEYQSNNNNNKCNFYKNGTRTGSSITSSDSSSLVSFSPCATNSRTSSQTSTLSTLGWKEDSRSDRRWWALLFFLSVPPNVLMNVGQTLYMIRYTHNPDLIAWMEEEAHTHTSTQNTKVNKPQRRRDVTRTREREDNNNNNTLREQSDIITTSHNVHGINVESNYNLEGQQQQQEEEEEQEELLQEAEESIENEPFVHHHVHSHGEDTIVKLVMLATGTTLQSCFALLLLPIDALPWFGGSSSVDEAWVNLGKGLSCLLHCRHNFVCCCLYSLGFVWVYIGAAYLNQYSVTLCSMVSQLAAPITALVLIVFPSWNVTGDVAPWYANVIAIVMLVAGTLIYVKWDTATADLKAEGQRRLQLQLLGLIPDHYNISNSNINNDSNNSTLNITGTLTRANVEFVEHPSTFLQNNSNLHSSLLCNANVGYVVVTENIDDNDNNKHDSNEEVELVSINCSNNNNYISESQFSVTNNRDEINIDNVHNSLN